MSKKIVITQSNYIPWKGFYDAINISDEFVIYDDMQYTRRDWRNRNKIKTPQGIQWLTIPVEVKGKYFQKINETIISDDNWNKNHWIILKQNYSKSNCFHEVKDMVEDWYATAGFKYLTEINIHFLQKVSEFLKIKTNWHLSSEFNLAEEKTERLVNVCKVLQATDYYSGPSAKSYINEDLFLQNNINIHYFDYNSYPEYSQLNQPFEHSVTILDLIFNVGSEAKKYLKCFNK